MSANPSETGQVTVALDEQERSELLQLLEHALGETRVEVHRTHTPDFREQVKHREDLLRKLIQKFRQPGA